MFGFLVMRWSTSSSKMQVLGNRLESSLSNSLRDSLDASVAMRSKISLTKEFRIAIALLEIPVSGWTCFNTE